MAAVVGITITAQDDEDQKSTMHFFLPATVTLAQATSAAQALVTLVDAITSGVIISVSMAFGVALPGGIKVTPTLPSKVENGARFAFRTAGGYISSVRISTFDQALIGANSSDVDVEDADVAAFVNALEDGTGLGGGLPCDYRGDDITALIAASKQSRSERTGG